MKKILSILIILIGVALIVVGFTIKKPGQSNPVPEQVITDARNATYTIDGTPVTLVYGVAQTPAVPGSASMTTTKYFGNEATGDFNGDGKEDVAFLITQDGGGSGTFFYVTALLSSGNTYHGTNAVLLGDRIAPQTTEFSNGQIVVNYADRKSTEPMSAQPSVGVSKYFKVTDGMLVAVSEQAIPGPALPVACTMDAKMCPDGSYVGRTAPKCEFAPCPGIK